MRVCAVGDGSKRFCPPAEIVLMDGIVFVDRLIGPSRNRKSIEFKVRRLMPTFIATHRLQMRSSIGDSCGDCGLIH